MKLKEINTWWKKEIDQARARHLNVPKSPKRQPFLVPEDHSEFAPVPGGFTVRKKLHAR